MKTIITATGNTIESKFDLRYGRAKYFCLYNDDDKSTTFIPNQHMDAQSGAGTKVAEQTIELGVNRVISGDFGPKAKEMLDKFKVQMIIIEDANQSIADLIQKMK